MNSTKLLSHYTHLPLHVQLLQPQQHLRHSQTSPTISMSFPAPRRRHRRRAGSPPFEPSPHSKTSSSYPDPGKLQFVIDVDQLRRRASFALQRTLTSLESKLDRMVSSGYDAFEDLRTLISVDPCSRSNIVVSCKPSSVRFVGELVVWSCVVVVAVRALLGFGVRVWGGRRVGGTEVVLRRDRSLGGREVVVGRTIEDERKRKHEEFMSATRALEVTGEDSFRREGRRLPDWWPAESSSPVSISAVDREIHHRAAKKLVRGMMDDRVIGKGISDDDIIKLRQHCRKSGAKVSFGTVNFRDSFYRLAVDFVVNTCCKASSSTEVDSEDPRSFLAGLADNVGLLSTRAAIIVAAVVAAWTQLWFLQAWALELQGKHLDAMEELSKICVIHQIFTPEPFSPEMEMVARGLEKNLGRDQREFLLRTLVGVCGEGSRRSAAEALGLVDY
ncbi:hypothetical protein Dimus_000631 [Dionaea muscipula]